jgi:hypothetical protein
VPKGTRRAGPRGANEDVERRITAYRPQRVEETTWATVRPFVLDCVRRLPPKGWPVAIRTLRVLTQLATWTLGQGIALDAEAVFDPDTIERFVVEGLAENSSRATYRADLRRVAPLLTKEAPWEPRPTLLSRRQVAPPYTSAELGLLSADGTRQRTPQRRRAARALIALGAGVGLDGRWVTRVRARDVVVDGDTVLVRVGTPSARTVPVLHPWRDEVAELAATAGHETLVGGISMSRNRSSSLIARLEVPPGHPRLSLPRLRSTWLLWHLTTGTRLPELAAAAGLQGVAMLSDLLQFVPPLDERDAHLMLRGATQ